MLHVCMNMTKKRFKVLPESVAAGKCWNVNVYWIMSYKRAEITYRITVSAVYGRNHVDLQCICILLLNMRLCPTADANAAGFSGSCFITWTRWHSIMWWHVMLTVDYEWSQVGWCSVGWYHETAVLLCHGTSTVEVTVYYHGTVIPHKYRGTTVRYLPANKYRFPCKTRRSFQRRFPCEKPHYWPG